MSSLSTPLVFCCILRIWQILTELSLTLLCKDMIPGCKVNEWIRTTATLRVMAENFAIDTRRPTEMLYMRRHRLSYSKFQAFHTTMESFTQWAWLKMSIGRPTLHKMIKSAARNINLTSFRFAGNPDWSRHSSVHWNEYTVDWIPMAAAFSNFNQRKSHLQRYLMAIFDAFILTQGLLTVGPFPTLPSMPEISWLGVLLVWLDAILRDTRGFDKSPGVTGSGAKA